MLREYYTQDIFTGLVLVCLIILVVARNMYSIRFGDFLAAVYNLKYVKLYTKEKAKLDIFNLLLFINLIIATAIFCFLAINNLTNLNLEIYTNLFLLILALTIILISKSFLEQIVGHFFEISEFIKSYLFYKSTFKYLSGLILLLSSILLLFSNLDKKTTIFVTFGFLFLINLSGYIRFLKLYQKALINNFFYFLLYLCALEIGPYVILYKVFKDYFE